MRKLLDDISVTFARGGRRRAGSRRLAVSGWRAAVWAVVIVVAPTLVTPPAAAQMGGPWWTTKSLEVRESDGEVVLTLKFTNGSRPGRVRYQTFDGTARAPEDYTALNGEVIFNGSEAMTIRIPVVDDDLAEGSEDFTVRAWEEPPPADPWPPGPNTATVRIIEDDQKRTPAGSSSPAGSTQQTTGSQGGLPARTESPLLAAPASSGSTGAGNQLISANPDDTTGGPGEANSGKEVRPSVDKAVGKSSRFSSVPLAGLGALVIVLIAAAGFAVKKKLSRRLT